MGRGGILEGSRLVAEVVFLEKVRTWVVCFSIADGNFRGALCAKWIFRILKRLDA